MKEKSKTPKKRRPKPLSDLPVKLKKYEPAVAALRSLLLAHENDRDLTCHIYCFGSPSEGIRIAEISFTRRTGRARRWRSEPAAGNIILAAEDFLLTWFIKPVRPKGWDSDIDEHGDAIWKLENVLKNKL